MSRRVIIWLAVLIPLGVVAGLVGRALMTPGESRGARMVSLFVEECLDGQGAPLDPDRFVRRESIPGEVLWVEEASALAVEFRDGYCGISDVLLHVAQDQHPIIDQAVSDLVAARFPELTAERDNLFPEWDRYLNWSELGPDGDPLSEISLFRFERVGGDAATTLARIRHIPE